MTDADLQELVQRLTRDTAAESEPVTPLRLLAAEAITSLRVERSLMKAHCDAFSADLVEALQEINLLRAEHYFAAKQERERIVDLLRGLANLCGAPLGRASLECGADAVERGDHLKAPK